MSESNQDFQTVTALVQEHRADTQMELKRLRDAVRRLYRKMEHHGLTRSPEAPDHYLARSADTQLQVIQYLRENLEKFNEATDRLTQIHADMQEWRSVTDELRQLRTILADTRHVAYRQFESGSHAPAASNFDVGPRPESRESHA